MSLKRSMHTNRRTVCGHSRRWHAKPKRWATGWCRRKHEFASGRTSPSAGRSCFTTEYQDPLAASGRGKLLPGRSETTAAFQPVNPGPKACSLGERTPLWLYFQRKKTQMAKLAASFRIFLTQRKSSYVNFTDFCSSPYFPAELPLFLLIS